MSTTVEFSFRVWVYPEDRDSPDIEVWFHDLEPTGPNERFVSEWVKESLYNEDFYDLFDLDKDKYWQVVGKGTLHGFYDYYGEYDEEFKLLEFKKAEVPSDYYKSLMIIEQLYSQSDCDQLIERKEDGNQKDLHP